MPFNLSELEEYAKQHRVPILHPDSVQALKELIEAHQPQTILEVGTAIGYSAMQMASVDVSIQVITLERDPEMVTRARANIKARGFDNQITVVEGEAAEYVLHHEVDLLFIDAGKAQYQVMFERFSPKVSAKGIVVCDNYFMHGLTVENAPKHQRTMARKLSAFKDFLRIHPEFHTTILEVGDGLSVSVRR
jgi:predicted O-methyltransferase YrrM